LTVSRGIGRTQRLALLALWQTRTERDIGIPLTELKRHMGEDRSNNRRAIRNLVACGMVEESREGGQRRVKLTSGGWGALAFTSMWEDITPDTIPSKPFDFDLIFRESDFATDDGGTPPCKAGHPMQRDADLESPVNDNGRPHAAGEPPGEPPCGLDTDLELPVSDNEESHARGEIPCPTAGDLEPPVTDNAIRAALEHLERGLRDG